MANDVFANGREISCKAADGKSIAAFPDVCMTPPENPTTPPGVPVPYPNTGMATDATSGSKSVKISRKEVMLKNKSYFKKSTGDEAGSAAKKGVVTSVNRGKVYFTAWSMDVKFEGENVVRHQDLMTHNHASAPGNTITWPYIDMMAAVSNTDHPCHEDVKKEREKCEKHEVKYSTGRLNRSASLEKMCDDPECAEARKCTMTPYGGSGSPNCCDGKTGHHLIPVHCFMPPGVRKARGSERYPGCDNYDDRDAPCVCVPGESKTGQHGEMHALFDDIEDSFLTDEGKAGSWTYSDARDTASMATNDVLGCDEACTSAQIDGYHKQDDNSSKAPSGRDKPSLDDNTALRADSSGNRTPEGFSPSVTAAGTDF